MFKWHKRWSVLLLAVVSIFLGLRMLVPLLLFYIDKSSDTAMQEYEWAIIPQEEKIEYRRHGYDICTLKNNNGTATLYLKKADGTIITSRAFNTYKNGNTSGWLVMNEYGIVRIGDLTDKLKISYAGIISLDDMPRSTFNYANPDAPFCLQYEGDRWGYVNRQGFWMIQPENYEDATQFTDKYAVVRYAEDGTHQFHILNMDGSLSPCGKWSKDMDTPRSFGAEINDGMLLMKGSSGYYFLNVEGNSFFPEGTGYEEARDFSEGLAAVKENGLWGYVDKEGQYILPPRYSSAWSFSNDYAYVIDQNGQPLVIDRAGEIVSSKIGEIAKIGGYAGGCYIVSVGNGKYNLVDLEGKLCLPKNGVEWPKYKNGVWITDSITAHEGVFLPQCRKYIAGNEVYAYETVVIVNSENKGTLYDKATGEVLYRCKEISPFYEGLAVAKKGMRQTFIDTQGRELLTPRFVQLGNFSDGLASVTLADGTSGMIANPLIYDEWAEDDNVRASALGIEPIPAEFLSYGEMWDRLAVVGECIYDAHAVFKTDDPDTYRVDVTEIRKSLELAGYPSEGIVDREHMAVALTALASEYGIVTEGFLMFYDDKGEVTDSCESAMAYISTLCLFDMDGANILPQKPVSGSEAQAYLLRFFERMIDQARYPYLR